MSALREMLKWPNENVVATVALILPHAIQLEQDLAQCERDKVRLMLEANEGLKRPKP